MLSGLHELMLEKSFAQSWDVVGSLLCFHYCSHLLPCGSLHHDMFKTKVEVQLLTFMEHHLCARLGGL